MKKLIILSICLGFLLSCSSLSKKPLVTMDPTLLKAQEDINALKIKSEGEINAVKGDLAALKGDVTGVKGDIAVVKGNIDKLAEINAKLNAQLQTTLNAVAGVNNKVDSIKAGRDIIQTTTNDTKLMQYIIKGLVGLCATLIGILGWCLKFLVKTSTEKKFFKEMVLTHLVQTPDDLKKIKALEEEFYKTKGYRKNNNGGEKS